MKILKIQHGLKMTLHKMALKAIKLGMELFNPDEFKKYEQRDTRVNPEPIQLPKQMNDDIEDLVSIMGEGADKKSMVIQLLVLGVNKSNKTTFTK